MEGHASAAARRTEMEQSLADALAQSEQAGEAVRSHSAQSAAAAAAALAAHTSSLRENLTGSHKALIQAASQVKEVTCTGESLASPLHCSPSSPKLSFHPDITSSIGGIRSHDDTPSEEHE